jgi:hypothetical protein
MTDQTKTPAPGADRDGRDDGAHPGQAALRSDSTKAERLKDALTRLFPDPETKRFCAWREQARDGRTTKVPFGTGAKQAKSDNADTWLTRAEAEALAAHPDFKKGVAQNGRSGFGVFLGLIPGTTEPGFIPVMSHEGDRLLIGIDADSCRDPETGAFTRPWAERLLTLLPSYAEVSPSDTGFKIFALLSLFSSKADDLSLLLGEGKLGRQWKEASSGAHPPGVELYTGKRYFTFTGRRLPQAPETINLITLDALRTLVQELGPSVNGDRAQNAKASAGAKTKPRPTNKRPTNGSDHRNEGGRQSDEDAKDTHWVDAPEPLRSLKSAHSAALLAGDFSHLDDQSNNVVAFHLALQCRRANMFEDETRDTLARYPHRDLSKYCGTDPDAERQWQRIWEKTTPLPTLEVRGYNLPETAAEAIEALCATDGLYLRGHRPVELSFYREGNNDGPKVTALSLHGFTRRVHSIRRVWQWKATPNGTLVQRNVTLPERVAGLALDHLSAWRDLPPLEGITSAPLLSDDGTVRTADGYDPVTGFFCFNAPSITISERPTRGDAEASLLLVRRHLRTFAFADAERVREMRLDVVDISKPPRADESAALHALLTAICRPSLWLAPGFLCTAASVSGAGAGKGLLVRAITAIALGIRPSAISPGHNMEELDKRLVAALIDARPVVFVDNLNNTTLKSDTLASALTERPANLRVLGKSETASVTAAPFIAITGNGLTLSEDLARRFVSCAQDGGEDAESRDFEGFPKMVEESFARRNELMAAALTIWRWGRQNPQKAGKPIGSFEQWSGWVRDPLLALGCVDPADRIAEAKAKDPQRAFLAEFFAALWAAFRDRPWTVAEIMDPSNPSGRIDQPRPISDILDPSGKMPRQWVANRVAKLEGTRAIGLILKRVAKISAWNGTRYFLAPETHGPIGPTGPIPPISTPMCPISPMAYDPSTPDKYEGEL